MISMNIYGQVGTRSPLVLPVIWAGPGTDTVTLDLPGASQKEPVRGAIGRLSRVPVKQGCPGAAPRLPRPGPPETARSSPARPQAPPARTWTAGWGWYAQAGVPAGSRASRVAPGRIPNRSA